MKPLGQSVLLPLLALAALAVAAPSTPPEFTHRQADDWINSDPLTLASLRGKVVLVEFWAFECVNCLNSRAWVESTERSKAGAGLVIIGVHTPELAAERSPSAVRQAVERLGIHYPVMIDGDSSYWNALHNQYWPTFYLIGRDGLLYGTVPGELHIGDGRAKKVEAALDLMLKAPAT
jgi:thiol-disulfide isomerase/thioredoxin